MEDSNIKDDDDDNLTRTTQQAKHAPSPSEWLMRVGAAYTQPMITDDG